MIDKVLPPGSGVTYDLFVDTPPEEPEEKPEPELDEEGNPIPVEPIPEPEKLPKFMVVPQVVREGRMHFFKVPKLGSYLAIKLEYQSCLFEEALDEGVKERLAVIEKEKQQAEERAAFEKAEQERREATEEGEEFKPEEKVWETIAVPPFKTQTVQLVCCINTMGQDRVLTEEERMFALRTVQRYRDRWEQSEQDNLRSDIEAKI